MTSRLFSAVTTVAAAAGLAVAQPPKKDGPDAAPPPRSSPAAAFGPGQPQFGFAPGGPVGWPQTFPTAPGGSVVIIVVGGHPQAFPLVAPQIRAVDLRPTSVTTTQAGGASGNEPLTATLRAQLTGLSDAPGADPRAIRQELTTIAEVLVRLAQTQERLEARLRRLEDGAAAPKDKAPVPRPQ